MKGVGRSKKKLHDFSTHHQLSYLKRLNSLEQQLTTCNYQLTKLYTKVELMSSWFKNKYGVEFDFRVLDGVVLEPLQQLDEFAIINPTSEDESPAAATSLASVHSVVNVTNNVEDTSIMDVQIQGSCIYSSVDPGSDGEEGTTTTGTKNMKAKAKNVRCKSKHKEKKNAFRPVAAKSKNQAVPHSTSFLKKHWLDEGGTKCYLCSWKDCNKSFKFKSQLTLHLNRHRNIKPYSCSWKDCPKSFQTRTELKRHMIVHTGERKFNCNYSNCEKSFSSKNALTLHQRIHLGERNFKCDYPSCGKTFIHKTNLINHIRIHTDEKPFICGFCDLTFRHNDNRKIHIRRWHTKEKPFKCEICKSKAFACSTDLRKHQKSHHT